ncbi:MAG: hypothetical protein ACPGJV_04260 [Bacteriovoracaceae bacterium]
MSLFFLASGINHFLTPHVLHEYMEYRKFKHSKALVFLSGVLLVICGPASLISHYDIRVYTSYALGVFVSLAAFMVHSFWKEKRQTSQNARSSKLHQKLRHLF